MSRLIDADKLNTEFAEILTALKGGMGKESITREEFAEAIKILKGCVDEQPTAYDVEKVVAELEEAMVCGMFGAGFNKNAMEIIEIVKAGGVE